MQQYRSETMRNPLGPQWRIWRGCCALYVTDSGSGFVYLRRIMAIPSGHGHGSECLRWLIDLAATHGKIIYGHASRFSDRRTEGPGTRKLREWYRKHGARFDRRGGFEIDTARAR